MTRRVLVTGAAGQDGGYLVERLAARGDEVHALVRAADAGERLEPEPRVESHAGDLADLVGTTRLVDELEPDVVFNLGGISSVAYSWAHASRTALVSGAGAVALLEGVALVARRTGREPRFVQASSAEIFGNSPAPLVEDSPIAPVNPYGAAKALAHRHVGFARTAGRFASAAILFNHESPRRPATFVSRKITQGAARIAAGLDEELRLGNLDARRDWGWAPDVVDALLRMSDADEPDDFVVATGESHSVGEFALAALAAAGVDDGADRIVVDERFVRRADARDSFGDASRIEQRLGWRPRTGFAGVVAAMVAHDADLVASGAEASELVGQSSSRPA